MTADDTGRPEPGPMTESTPLVVTARRLYRLDVGIFDDELRFRCPGCNDSHAAPRTVLAAIEELTSAADMRPGDSPIDKLPDGAWEDSRLLVGCNGCGRSLKFNPFVVDERL